MHEQDQLEFEKKLDLVLETKKKELLSQLVDDQKWDFHPHLGVHFLSQYSLCLKWLGVTETDLDDGVILAQLIKAQLADGSWQQLPDENLKSGELNATIFNYWFLKSVGQDPNGTTLAKARNYILSRGGIEASSLFTKTFLALFNQFPWTKLSRIPYLLFIESLPSNYKSFSQWLIPHLMPMAYLRAKKVSKDLGANFDLPELWKGKKPKIKIQTLTASFVADRALVKKILSRQQPKGSWGGYTVSTLLSAMTLQHFGESRFINKAELELAFRKGLSFIDQLYVHAGDGSYQGCLMDGHYWDTILCANALIDAGATRESIVSVCDYILKSQQPNGGFPYGYDFEYAPDVDDTAQAILLFAHDKNRPVARAAKWLLDLQNDDGGWGAFDKNNVGNPVLRVLTKPYQNSADLFDDSSADSTGHVLEALARAGLGGTTACHNAIAYLKSTQEANGGWTGRWAVNFLFGTTCALIGLVKAGEPPHAPYVKRAIDFLCHLQNTDGGFGESTESYLEKSLVGRGISTPTQTGWVLSALCACGLARDPVARRAAQYLMGLETWVDGSVTGTGHPGVLNMNYPSYAKAFALSALGIYRRSF